MNRKVGAILLVLAILCGLCACGDQPQKPNDPEDSEVSVSDTEPGKTDGGDSTADASQADTDAGRTDSTKKTTGTGTGKSTASASSAKDGATKLTATKATTAKKGETTKQASKTTKTTGKTPAKAVKFADLDLSDMTVLPEAEGADSGKNGKVYVIEMEALRNRLPDVVMQYDAVKFLCSLQGLENRKGPLIFVEDGGFTNRWFRFFRATTDGLLYGKETVKVRNVDAALKTFGDAIKSHGIVVWDPAQPFTANIATNVCGVEGYLPVMYSDEEDSLYCQLTEKFGASIVKMDLRGKFTGKKGSKIWDTSVTSVGSAKCDAYLWAMEKYVKTGKTSKAFVAYMVDFYPLTPKGTGNYLDNSVYETYLPDQDYVVQNAIFTFDLSPWSDEAATDDPTQPVGEDYRTFCKLLQYQYDRNNGAFSQCIGFPGFVYKYTNRVGGKHADVQTEWKTVEVVTAYNVVLQADCPGPSSMYNCSLYSQYQQQVTYSQAAKRKQALDNLPAYDKNAIYFCVYMGDYDAASWVFHVGQSMWSDRKRGEIPLAWGFNPNLMERAPMLWDYYYTTATDNDFFVGGDSGAGYINPSLLQAGKRQHSSLPDGLSAWTAWCKKWYKKADLSVTGMLLNGNSGYPGDKVMQAYAQFSPDGVSCWSAAPSANGMGMVGDLPVVRLDEGWGANATAAANHLWSIVSGKRPYSFFIERACVVSPTLAVDSLKLLQQKAASAGKRLVVLDPYTFFAMVKRELTK